MKSMAMRVALAVYGMLAVALAGGAARYEQAKDGGEGDGPSAVVAAEDKSQVGDRLRSLMGACLILGVAVLMSENRRKISARVVLWGLGLQVGLGLFLLRVPLGRTMLSKASALVVVVMNCALEGAEFVFGSELVRADGPAGFVFAFRVLPTIIFVACLFAVLYHLRVMQAVVGVVAWLMVRLMGTSGAETLNAAASIFLGQTEAPLTIRPYLPRLTRSELMVVMVSGMALVAGGVLAAYIESGAETRFLLTAILMNAPGSILLSKLMVPETERPETLGVVKADAGASDANVLDAAARGTGEGLHLALNVAAILITFIGLITLVNMAVGGMVDFARGYVELPEWMDDLSLAKLFGLALAPVAWLIGVPWDESVSVGGLLGTRLVLNELIAYGELGKLVGGMSPRAAALSTVALCGFANLSSIGIQIGGIGALIPSRRSDLAKLGVKALLAASLSNLLAAALVGIFL